jgi:cold shock CspA family protein
MSSDKDSVTPVVASEHLLGRVKWFNNKAGYGFVTITDGIRSGTDVFVHHSAINVDSQQYKYLVQGEYVEFDLIRVESDKHEWQASLVSGIRGGKLMCETRHELKVARTEYKTTNPTSEEPRMPIQKTTTEPREKKTYAPRQRPTEPRQRPTEPRQRPTEPRQRPTEPRQRPTEPRQRPDRAPLREGDNKEWTLVSGRERPRKSQNTSTQSN